MKLPALIAALSVAGAAAAAHDLGRELPARAPRADFTLPAAGSYALPPIQHAPGGAVLDRAGRRHDLRRFVTGKVTLLSLFYSQCADPEGCPLAFATMAELRDRLAARPSLAARVRLVSLSFDPQHDTPARLGAFAGHLADRRVEWSFLTAPSPAALAPILDEFGQDIAVEHADDGGARAISHALKLFLIDRRGAVREIYSTAFLAPEAMFNDILTLLIEDGLAAH
ncbi:MAG: SCO family protein [Rhodospirillales bacterium]